ncbi:MAG TPA: hypothetical protein VET83_04300 [Candidatus Dormibacteraeota bacterium]|nr:hypothetical protein [Candidatus Dormibacteraeota bacterium]
MRIPRLVREHPYRVLGLLGLAWFFIQVLRLLRMERLVTGGEISLPLDDSFIYLQYARAIAEGHPFVYTPGNAPTTGATSLLWPFLLLPPHLLRLGPYAGIAWSLTLGAVALCVSAQLMARLGHVLGGTAGMLLAFLLFLLSPHLLWGYMTGMEIGLYGTVLLGSLLLYLLEREAAVFPRFRWMLFLLAVSRPEGAILCGVFGVAMALDRRRAARKGTVPGFFSPVLLLPFAAAALPFLVNLAVSGSIESTSSQAKSILAEPHPDIRHQFLMDSPKVWAAILAAYLSWLQLGIGAIMVTRYWIPTAAALTLFALFSFVPRRRPWQDGRVVLLLFPAAILVDSLPVAWSVHLYRYQQGFYPVVLLCLAAGIARAVTLMWTRLPRAVAIPAAALILGVPLWAWSPVFTEVYGGLVEFYGRNCENILHQQVRTGRWIAKALPQDAVVAMNDAGAIAYYGNRSTVDLIGLTTEGFAKAYRSGIGCLFEKLRRLPPGRLPTHFAIYPEWFPYLKASGVLGPEIFHAHLSDNTISGEDDKVVYPARWADRLHADSLDLVHPEIAGTRRRDRLDLAWLDDEARHGWVSYGYAFDEKRSVWRDRPSVILRDVLRQYIPANGSGRPVTDGGRKVFAWERFHMSVEPGKDAVLIARTDAWYPNRLTVKVDGAPAGVWTIGRAETTWAEPSFRIPGPLLVRPHPEIEVYREDPKDGGEWAPFHYWIYQ